MELSRGIVAMWSIQETIAINNKAVEEWQAKQSNLSYQANADSEPVDIRAITLTASYKGDVNSLMGKLMRQLEIANASSIVQKEAAWYAVARASEDVARTARFYADTHRPLL